MMKGGSNDGVISTNCKNLVSATSSAWKREWIHGDVYAMCSEWLSKLTDFIVPCVPHIVYLPDVETDMREELSIPKSDLVFGRNGGWETFDLGFVKSAISQVLSEGTDVWFVFQFTQPFIEHERVIYLPGTSDLNEKVGFINTCDMMLHARNVGESFGLSCGEFSIRNKPVITWSGSPEQNHIDILGDRGFFYNNKSDLLNILVNTKKEDIEGKDWNCYREYSPEKVVEKFKEVYL